MRGCRRRCRRTKRYGVPASAGGAFVVAETLEIRKRVASVRAAPTGGGTPYSTRARLVYLLEVVPCGS